MKTRIAQALVCLLLATAGAEEAKSLPEKPTLNYEAFFQRSSGWSGADGTYSIPLGRRGTLWSFSDTFFGEVEDGRRLRPFRFVNNSMVLQKGRELTFLEAPAFQPPDRKGWFWMGDALARSEQEVETLLLQFDKNGLGGAFGFEQVGLWWARFELPEGAHKVRVKRYEKLPFFQKRGEELITFGCALTLEGPWCYLYGIRQKGLSRDAVIARAPQASLGVPGTWRFFDGENWVRDIWACQALFPGASMEYSVHQSEDAYVYISCSDGGMSERVIARKAPTPFGPWSETQDVKTLPEHQGEVFCYNAKAHPELSRDGRILISYNVNTSDLEKVVSEADIYRPRFFWWTPPNPSWLPKPQNPPNP